MVTKVKTCVEIATMATAKERIKTTAANPSVSFKCCLINEQQYFIKFKTRGAAECSRLHKTRTANLFLQKFCDVDQLILALIF